MAPGVAPFPVGHETVLRAVRHTALASRRVSIHVDVESPGPWYERVTQRQVWRCLEEGSFTKEPVYMPEGYWKCQMERYSAGLRVIVDFAIGPIGSERCLIVVTAIEAE